MGNEIFSGFVKKLEHLGDNLTFVTLHPLEAECERVRIPIYSDLPNSILTKYVDIILYSDTKIKQEIHGSNFQLDTIINTSDAKKMIDQYKLKKFSH